MPQVRLRDSERNSEDERNSGAQLRGQAMQMRPRGKSDEERKLGNLMTQVASLAGQITLPVHFLRYDTQKPRRVDGNPVCDVSILRAGLAGVLRFGPSPNDLCKLGQVASATGSSLLLEAVAEVVHSAEATDFPRCSPSCRSRLRAEWQGPVASFRDVRSPASFVQRVPGRRGPV
jgi:hypothetical protein